MPKVNGLDLDEITLYLNSEHVQQYMHMLYKDITPHVTITQLKQLPIRRKPGGKHSNSLKFI